MKNIKCTICNGTGTRLKARCWNCGGTGKLDLLNG